MLAGDVINKPSVSLSIAGDFPLYRSLMPSPTLVSPSHHDGRPAPRHVLRHIRGRQRRHMLVVDGNGSARKGGGDPFVQVLRFGVAPAGFPLRVSLRASPMASHDQPLSPMINHYHLLLTY